jgi:hypothetical protein
MLTFGREQGNDIVVPSTSVSRQHAKLIPAGNHWVFCDLGSTNGSWINDESVPANRYRLLHSGDEIILADARFTVRLVAGPSNPLGRYTKSLLIFEDEKFTSEFSLENKETTFTIGGAGSHLRVPESPPGVTYLEVIASAGELIARPAGGYSAATLNGETLGESVALADGSVLAVANALILVNDNPKTILGDDEPGAESSKPTHHSAFDISGDQTVTGLPVAKSWDSTVPKTRTEMGRRFIFGKEQVDPNTTIPAKGAKSFDMSISRKVSSVPMEGELSPAEEKQRRILLGVLFIASALVLAVVATVLILLSS